MQFQEKITPYIIIAIVVAIAIQIILSKTTFGYELKATGNNKTTLKYNTNYLKSKQKKSNNRCYNIILSSC